MKTKILYINYSDGIKNAEIKDWDGRTWHLEIIGSKCYCKELDNLEYASVSDFVSAMYGKYLFRNRNGGKSYINYKVYIDGKEMPI